MEEMKQMGCELSNYQVDVLEQTMDFSIKAPSTLMFFLNKNDLGPDECFSSGWEIISVHTNMQITWSLTYTGHAIKGINNWWYLFSSRKGSYDRGVMNQGSECGMSASSFPNVSAFARQPVRGPTVFPKVSVFGAQKLRSSMDAILSFLSLWSLF